MPGAQFDKAHAGILRHAVDIIDCTPATKLPPAEGQPDFLADAAKVRAYLLGLANQLDPPA